MAEKLQPARVTIAEKHDDECWDIHCVCGWESGTNMAIEALEAAWEHYVNVPHRGRLFIDVIPDGIE